MRLKNPLNILIASLYSFKLVSHPCRDKACRLVHRTLIGVELACHTEIERVAATALRTSVKLNKNLLVLFIAVMVGTTNLHTQHTPCLFEP